jgi:hypothetical protein
MQPPNEHFAAKFIAPRALFLGIALSFLGCCLAGWISSHHHLFTNFVRFHYYINAESLYFPTASQVRELCKDHLEPDVIAVLIGGSSRMHGMGQKEERVWTRRLQHILGPRYHVLNLGLAGGGPQEFSVVAAEMLGREHPRLILVNDGFPGVMQPKPDGFHYRYFFWDAYFKGFTTPHPERDARLVGVAEEWSQIEEEKGALTGNYTELKRLAHLDSMGYFNDLWNTLAYSRFFTVWTIASQRPFTRPRKSFADPDIGTPPPEVRYHPAANESAMNGLRAHLAGAAVVKDAHNQWVEDTNSNYWDLYGIALRDAIPEALRPHTLIALVRYNPHFLRQLTEDERARYDVMMRLAVARTQAQGLTAFDVGGDYTDDDYLDWIHPSEVGGDKLAETVAAQVRERARSLGYLD